MGTGLALALFLLALSIYGPVARAQQCTTPVTSWQADYTLEATAANVSCGSGNGETCDIDQSASASGSFRAMTGQSCTALGWFAPAPIVPTTVSLANSYTSPCLLSGTVTQQFGQPTGSVTQESLNLDLTAGKYTFEPDAISSAIDTIVGCNGDKTSKSVQYLYTPILIGGTWPPKFSLPTSIQQLTGSTPFQALAATAAAPASWTFKFTLTSNFTEDDDCDQEGGSTIGCQNQRLGEDLPLAGTGFHLHYASDRAQIGLANGTAAADAAMLGGWTLNVHHAYDPLTNTLFLGDGTQRNGYQLGTPVSFDGNRLLTSEDGTEVYVFDPSTGRHLKTLNPLAGAIIYQFGYNASGRLVAVTDAGGNVTTIRRDGAGRPTAIVSPHGQRTTLAVDTHGFLSRFTDPLGHSATFVNTASGLLTSRTDANGNTYAYIYTGSGRLLKDADPAGGFTTLVRAPAGAGFGFTASVTTAMGLMSEYQTAIHASWAQGGTLPYSEQHTNTWPDGLQATSTKTLQNGKLSSSVTLPGGSSLSEVLAPDPVWGLQAPIITRATQTEGGLAMLSTASRSTTLRTPGNPFSVTSETMTETVNGRTTKSTFTGTTRTLATTSPAGRTTTVTLDALERAASIQVGNRLPTNFVYDSRGRLASTTQGTRTTKLSYGANGFLASATDAMGGTTKFGYDAAGELLSTTLSDGRLITYTYDANGNLASVMPPGSPAHSFSYTSVDLRAAYTPPAVSGTGATIYAYDLDRHLTTLTRPDGRTIGYGYDAAGRLRSIATPTGNITFAYAATGRLARAATSKESIAYSYTGRLPTTSAESGPVAGAVGRSYSNDFLVISQTVNGAHGVAYAYDQDGLTTKAGPLTITRRPADGLITGTILGVTSDTRAYNSYGELSGYVARVNGSPIWKIAYTRDADGRIIGKSETVRGARNSYSYTYDQAGRLIEAVKNGASDSYTYDANSNRLTGTVAGNTADGTYDAQDRLAKYGRATYSYTANGELAIRDIGTQITTYRYDVLGNLLSAKLPGGSSIAYIVDAEDHRVGKEVGGVLEAGFLYDGEAIVAQLDGANHVVSRFVYATRPTTPDYFTTGGVTYRIFSDERGSPVLVVNTATGAITEQITYDEFGNVTGDTNPTLQPFRFAGGLYDLDTKLVRFGARDYDPAVGRWTAKDPLLFGGGDTEFYGYAFEDPVNLTDPSGLGDLCDKIKKKIKDKAKKYIKDKTKTIKVGPIDVHTDRPAISKTVSVEAPVEVAGEPVASADATVEVGVTPSHNPRGPLFYVDAEGSVKIWKWTVGHVEIHEEFGDATKLTSNKFQDREFRRADQAACSENDACLYVY
jgi:RHS repeat-associated protein